MDVVLSFFVFPLSLIALIIGASYLLRGAQQLGIVIGISPFIVGAFIIAFGTSLPELAIAILSVIDGVNEVPVAQAIGSNVVNTLLVVAVAAIIARRIDVGKNLIDVEIPILVGVTILFVGMIYDGSISFLESIILLIVFLLYLLYLFSEKDNRSYPEDSDSMLRRLSEAPKDFFFVVFGLITITVAANLIIESMVSIAQFFEVNEGLVAATVLSLGTSLPELVVTIQGALKKQVELVIGSIIGSNIFNILATVGIPGLVGTLTIDHQSFVVGVPALIAVTLLFAITTISNRIHLWEGFLYLALYVLFIIKMLGIA